MTTVKALKLRPDVPDEDIDDIIEIAARLQDQARAAAEDRATVGQVKAIAAELDIDPNHVEAAIATLRQSRANAAEARQADDAAARAKRSLLLRITAAAALSLAVAAAGAAGLVGMGASDVRTAQAETAEAEAHVRAAVDRQASLAPQIAGLAGAGGADLAPLQQAVRNAPNLPAQLAAADALSTAMADRLGAMPPPTTDAELTLRTQLTDELTGATNRVGVALGRYRAARQHWATEASAGIGTMAVRMGFADAPD